MAILGALPYGRVASLSPSKKSLRLDFCQYKMESASLEHTLYLGSKIIIYFCHMNISQVNSTSHFLKVVSMLFFLKEFTRTRIVEKFGAGSGTVPLTAAK